MIHVEPMFLAHQQLAGLMSAKGLVFSVTVPYAKTAS